MEGRRMSGDFHRVAESESGSRAERRIERAILSAIEAEVEAVWKRSLKSPDIRAKSSARSNNPPEAFAKGSVTTKPPTMAAFENKTFAFFADRLRQPVHCAPRR